MEKYIIVISPKNNTFQEIAYNLCCRWQTLIHDIENRLVFNGRNLSNKSKACAIKIIDLKELNGSNDEAVVWKDLNLFTSLELKENDETSQLHFLRTKELSECIHKLADSLPPPGSYHVDIIWDWRDIESLKPFDHVELYGSIKRLISWHNCYTYILNDSEEKSEDCRVWVEVLGGEVVSSLYIKEKFNPWTTFWRGSISMYNSNNEISQSMFGFHLNCDENSIFDRCIFTSEEDGDPNEMVCTSSNIEVVSECDINSVPVYIIAPNALNLSLESKSGLLESSRNWLQKFNEQSKVALIVRLHYSSESISERDEMFAATTENWKNQMKKGNYKTSVPPMINHTHQLNFLLVSDEINSPVVKLHLLKTSYPLLGFLNERLGIQAKIMEIAKDTTETWIQTLESLPYYDTECIADALAVVKEVQLNVLSYWKSRLDEGDALPDLNSENIRHVFIKARQKVLERLIDQSTKAFSLVNVINEKTPPRAFVPSYLRDPNEWPERKAFERVKFEESQLYSSSSVADLGPDCNYFLMCFDSNGNAKNKPTLPEANDEQIEKPRLSVSLQWSEMNECGLNDEQTARRSQIKDNDVLYSNKYVEDETGSLYSSSVKSEEQRHRNRSDSSLSKSQLRRSPRAKKCIEKSPFVRMIERDRRKSSESPREISTPQSAVSKTGGASHEKTEKSKSKLPAKCRSAERKHSSQESRGMSEHHLRKLRNAVYDALSANGITPEHELFQVCGKKLISICKAFVHDVVSRHGSIKSQGSTSEQMKKIANAHVKQVIHFQMEFDAYRKRSSSP